MNPLDPLGLAPDAPLFAAWQRFSRSVDDGTLRPFSIPGHKQRTDLVGPLVAGDAPLHAGLDTVQLSEGLLADAEHRAAALWGADWCRFSVGGSTHANQAAVLAAAEPGRPVIVSRSLHRSVLMGLVLAGLRPVWVFPGPGGVAPAAVAAALEAHPDAAAVMVTDPSYLGAVGDVARIADVAHAGGVPLLVDAAWGAHFGFHPALPAHALAQGADALVISAHKTLPAMNQAALLLARTGFLDPDRLERAFEAGHTTSPSGAILASIDAARALLARDGSRRLGRLVGTVAAARERLSGVPGVVVDGGAGVDPAKLVIRVAGTGATGGAIEARLRAAGVPVEMADRDTVVPIVTLADHPADVDRLVDAVVAAVEQHRGPPREPVTASWSVVPDTLSPPREAFFAAHETVAAQDAVGRASAELIAPYPPGVPVLAPGERITEPILAVLRRVRDDGGRIAYAADPTLATFQVVTRTA